MKKQEQINALRFRIEQIESHLAEQHKGANFSKLNKPEAISDAPDYTHLLPDGYEFCSEADAEKWVKVESKASEAVGIVVDVSNAVDMHIMNLHWKPYYRPIRPIQYKVTTHEITTAIPDPYMPDWSKAPRWATSHCFNENGYGYWHGVMHDKGRNGAWEQVDIISPFSLPPDLDWKQSLRVKPN